MISGGAGRMGMPMGWQARIARISGLTHGNAAKFKALEKLALWARNLRPNRFGWNAVAVGCLHVHRYNNGAAGAAGTQIEAG